MASSCPVHAPSTLTTVAGVLICAGTTDSLLQFAEQRGVDFAINCRELDPYDGRLQKVVPTVYHLNFQDKGRSGSSRTQPNTGFKLRGESSGPWANFRISGTIPNFRISEAIPIS